MDIIEIVSSSAAREFRIPMRVSKLYDFCAKFRLSIVAPLAPARSNVVFAWFRTFHIFEPVRIYTGAIDERILRTIRLGDGRKNI